MNSLILHCLSVLALLSATFSVSQGQNTTCASTAPEILNQLHPTSITVTTPDPSGFLTALPSSNLTEMGYLIILKGIRDSVHNGNIIIGADDDGIFDPRTLSRYGISLADGDTIEIVPFAYQLSQFRAFVNDVFTRFIPPPTNASCCIIFDLNPESGSYCDSLHNNGINSINDINGINDVLDIVDYLTLGSISVEYFIATLNEVNNPSYSGLFINNNCADTSTFPFCFAISPSNRYGYKIDSIQGTGTQGTVVNENACFSYTSPSGNHTWTNSSTYLDTLTNVSGGDSILIINLTVHTINDSIYINGFHPFLSANASPASYQWLDCNAGNSPISGATTSMFTPTTNGSYALEITQNGCTATSSCITTDFWNCSAYSTSFTISQNPNDLFELSIQPYITGASPNNNIHVFWNYGDGTYQELHFSDSANHVYNSFGTYELCLYVHDSTMGCSASYCDTFSLDSLGTLSRGTGIFSIGVQPFIFGSPVITNTTESPNSTALHLFPNPNFGILNLELNSPHQSDFQLQIFDMKGQLLQRAILPHTLPQQFYEIDTKLLSSGVYLLRLVSEREVISKPFVKG